MKFTRPWTWNADVEGEVRLPTGRPAGQAVVFLEGAVRARPLPEAIVDQRNRTFLPHISVVTVGTTVRFPNNDTIFHNVFASFDAKRFDLGMYPRGASRTQRFDKPGLVALQCNVHSEMSAYIWVVDTPFYTIADRAGRFRLAGVAPGNYTLRLWHESGARLGQSLTVGERVDPLKLTLTRA